jgi:hypothetical protein
MPVERLLDAIDEALLAGEQERVRSLVEQLWGIRGRVPEALTSRIIGGRSQMPAFDFELLGGFAGARAPTYLRRIANNTDVEDIVRFGAQRRAGWPEHGQTARRRKFLASLRDPDETLVVAVDQASHYAPPEMEILEEVLGYLAVMPVEARETLVRRMADQVSDGAIWLLRALLHDDAPAIQRLALAELLRMKEPSSAGAASRLARTTHDEELRSEATAVGQRLRLQVVSADRSDETLPFGRLDRALLSLVDGDGGQVIIVVRDWGTGAFSFVDLFHNDHYGLKGVFGASRATPEKVEDLFQGLEEVDLDLVEVDLATARGVVERAIGVNATSGNRIPPNFELWEPLLHDSYPPAGSEPLADAELDDAPYAGRRDLVNAGRELIAHPWFESWGFDTARTSAVMAGVPRPTGRRLTDRQYRPLIETLADPPTLAVLRKRLRRQAWLLDRDGEEWLRDVALATATDLANAAPPALAKQPFLRALVDSSVERVLQEYFFGF